MRSLAWWIAPAVLAVIFLLTGAAKVDDPDGFGLTIFILTNGWFGERFSVVMALAIGVAELVLGLLTLVYSGKRLVYQATIGVLCAFSAVLLWMLTMENPPSCGCLGSGGPDSSHAETLAGLGRNAGLIWLGLWHLGQVREDRKPARAARGRPAAPGGFTIIEVLVVVAIVSVLFAVLFPAFAHARREAHDRSRTLVVRQLNTALSLYTTDHGDTFPFFATRGDPLGPVVLDGATLPFGYFRQNWFWATAVVPEYYPDRASIEPEAYPAALAELGLRESIVATRMVLTQTAFAAPRYWDDTVERESWYRLEHFRPTRTGEVRFPAQKGLIAENLGGPAGSVGPWPVALADGSARLVSSLDTMHAVERPYVAGTIPILSTPKGLGGRDFE